MDRHEISFSAKNSGVTCNFKVTGYQGDFTFASHFAIYSSMARPDSDHGAETKLPMKPDGVFRSGCSIARSLELVGDKWTLLIIRDLMWHNKETFQALQHSEEHIPTNILASRLKKLIELDLVEKSPYQDRPVRYRYSLTESGRTLEPVLKSLMAWGHQHLSGGFFDPATGKSTSAD